MRYIALIVSLFFTCFILQAQTAKDLIAALQAINYTVVKKGCGTDSAAAISHRAMNIFLADKTSYLSASRDLSYYTNYVTFNTTEAKFTVNHNFQQTTGTDAPIKSLISIGFDMTVANSYAKGLLDKRFENEIGLTVNYKWLGKVKTKFADCNPAQNITRQQQAMNALRASLTAQLQDEITKKENDFNLVLNTIDSSAFPGQSVCTAKMLAQKNFYIDIKAEYDEKFATNQAALLNKTGNYQSISTHWTSITAYIPLLFPVYTVSPSFASAFTKKHPYPFSLLLSHTRMWESSKRGRLFFTLDAGLLFNNSKLSYGLSKMNFSEYKSLGGTGILQTADPGNNKLYIGSYKTFLTPSLTARLVYFPAVSHVGISLQAEKSVSNYNLLNAKLGIPVVLINSKKTPAVTVECYVLFLDITNQLNSLSKSTAGLSIGIPFSRLMY